MILERGRVQSSVQKLNFINSNNCLINEEYITTLHPDFSSHIFGTLFLIRKCNPQTFGDEFDSHQ